MTWILGLIGLAITSRHFFLLFLLLFIAFFVFHFKTLLAMIYFFIFKLK